MWSCGPDSFGWVHEAARVGSCRHSWTYMSCEFWGSRCGIAQNSVHLGYEITSTGKRTTKFPGTIVSSTSKMEMFLDITTLKMRTSRCFQMFDTIYSVTHSYIAEEQNSQASCSTKHRRFLGQLSDFLVMAVRCSWLYTILRLKQKLELEPQNEGIMRKAGLNHGLYLRQQYSYSLSA